MQTFPSKFTTDISLHQRTIRAFRDPTCGTQQAGSELIPHSAVSLEGVGLKEMTGQTIRFGEHGLPILRSSQKC